MANEARVWMRSQDPSETVTFTVAAATAIAKGTVMVATIGSDMTVVAHSAADQGFIGIADESKDASDGQVDIAVVTGGIIEFIAGGTIPAGQLVKLDTTA